MNRKLVIVLLDACRGDYISKETTPFLFRLKDDNRYFQYLIPGFGFCERTEIFVGKEPLESNYFTALGWSPEESPYKKLKTPLKFLGKIEEYSSSPFLSKVIRRFIWELVKNKDGTFYPFRIPLNKLSDFRLTEDGPKNLIDNSDESLYQIARKVYKEASTSLNTKLSGSDKDRLDLIIKGIKKSYDFYPTYISSLDVIGHQYGPNSIEIKNELSRLDSTLEGFYSKLQDFENPPVLVFCGDHGMSPIKSHINIQLVIDKLISENYLLNGFNMFLDSTMARFWFDKKISSDISVLKKILENNFKGKGFFLLRADYQNFGVPDSDLYGDCIWICHDGILISPDYFSPSNKVINGMHGYQPLSFQHYGFAIIAGKDIKREHFDTPKPLSNIYADMKNYLLSSNTLKK
jgi:predicted AlkP superfamily pyrophosphatase or phosphodiesterase